MNIETMNIAPKNEKEKQWNTCTNILCFLVLQRLYIFLYFFLHMAFQICFILAVMYSYILFFFSLFPSSCFRIFMFRIHSLIYKMYDKFTLIPRTMSIYKPVNGLLWVPFSLHWNKRFILKNKNKLFL